MDSSGQTDLTESLRGDESLFLSASQNNTDWKTYQNRLDKLKQGAADRWILRSLFSTVNKHPHTLSQTPQARGVAHPRE